MQRIEAFISLLSTKAKVARGAGNQPDAKTGSFNIEVNDIVWLQQSISKHVETQLASTRSSQIELDLGARIFQAILSELYQCGNCDEQSALLYYQYIKSGITVSIEVLYVNGLIQEIQNNTLIFVPAGHALVVVNRDKNTNLDRPDLWNEGVSIHDPWAGFVSFFNPGERPTHWDLLGNYLCALKINSTVSVARVEGKLTDDDWRSIISYLSEAKKIITLKYINDLLVAGSMTHLKGKEELTKIYQKIDTEIEVCKKLINPPNALKKETNAITKDSKVSTSPLTMGVFTSKVTNHPINQTLLPPRATK